MPSIELKITMNEQGVIEVSGPLENRVACYAMLGVAHDVVKDHHDSTIKKRALVTPTADDLGRLPPLRAP